MDLVNLLHLYMRVEEFKLIQKKKKNKCNLIVLCAFN